MKYLIIAVTLLLLSACSMPLVALAQPAPAHGAGPARGNDGAPPAFGPGPGGAQGLPPFLHGIALSEAQQDKVFAASHAQAPLLREQQKIAFKAHEQLRQLAASSTYDDARAGALANTAAQAMAQASLLQARLQQQLLALLTPEQRQQVEQRRAEHAGQPRAPR